MARENIVNVSHPATLTGDEAVTLRRVALGESDVRSLRRADIERLLALRLIEEGKSGMTLTISGKQHFDTLPRGVFAIVPRPRREQ